MFTIHAQSQIKEQFPTLTLCEQSKKKGELWAAMSDEEKQPYNTLAQRDVERFDREVLELRTQGWFTNKDGVKSTDLKRKLTRDDKKKAAETKIKEADLKAIEKTKTLEAKVKEVLKKDNPKA